MTWCAQMTIEQLKVKLSFHVGTSPSAQVLQLLDDQGQLLVSCMDDSRKLGFYSPHDGCAGGAMRDRAAGGRPCGFTGQGVQRWGTALPSAGPAGAELLPLCWWWRRCGRRYQIHVVDLDPQSASAGGWLEDVSLVDKYVMSDDEYNKKENTYRCAA